RRLAEDAHVVDGAERAQDSFAIGLRNEGPSRALDRADGRVAVEAHDESIAERPRAGEEIDVAAMKEVEAAVREDDRHGVIVPGCHEESQLRRRAFRERARE